LFINDFSLFERVGWRAPATAIAHINRSADQHHRRLNSEGVLESQDLGRSLTGCATVLAFS
jgi:hypothetical protein